MLNETYKSCWYHATNKTADLKYDKRTYKVKPSTRFGKPFLNFVASDERPVVASDCLLHYMLCDKKKPFTMSPQHFLTHFHEALQEVKILDCCYKKELDDEWPTSCSFESFPQPHITNYVYQTNHNFDNIT